MDKMDLHVHTTYSDGNVTVEGAIQEAKSKKLSYLAITDHFTTTWKRDVINTLTSPVFEQYWEEIKAERQAAGFKCLIGVEIDAKSHWGDVLTIFTRHNIFEIVLFEYVDSIVLLNQIAFLVQELEVKTIIALAHNSYFKMANIEKFSEILVENNIYFELNAAYLNYADQQAIQKLKIMKDNGVRFTLGSDAHVASAIGQVDLSLSILERIDGMQYLIDLSALKF